VRSLHESYSQFCELFTLCEHLPKVAERAAVLKNQALDQGREGGSRLRAVSPVAAHADPKPPPLSRGVGTTCPPSHRGILSAKVRTFERTLRHADRRDPSVPASGGARMGSRRVAARCGGHTTLTCGSDVPRRVAYRGPFGSPCGGTTTVYRARSKNRPFFIPSPGSLPDAEAIQGGDLRPWPVYTLHPLFIT
jgi:hypothetical protein